MAVKLYNKIYKIIQNSWAIIIIVASIFIPPSVIEHSPVICPFRLVTGLRCPGCGMTHSFVFFFHGKIAEAISSNILSAIVIPFFVFIALKQVLNFIKRNSHNTVL
jgi:hypothetical protein